MDPDNPLRGACTCGRNQYLILTPQPIRQHLRLLNQQSVQGQELSLRIPLIHLRSTTYAFHPDEAHHSIRRLFSPTNAPHVKRHFCGFCGTPLSSWNESSHEEAEWISVNVGSLRNESLTRLEQSLAEEDPATGPRTSETALHHSSGNIPRDMTSSPWFEETVESNELGRIKRQRGGHTSADGKSKIEWEVVEVGDEEKDSSHIRSKRKLNEYDEGGANDVRMQGQPL